jgi:hypothetical protein
MPYSPFHGRNVPAAMMGAQWIDARNRTTLDALSRELRSLNGDISRSERVPAAFKQEWAAFMRSIAGLYDEFSMAQLAFTAPAEGFADRVMVARQRVADWRQKFVDAGGVATLAAPAPLPAAEGAGQPKRKWTVGKVVVAVGGIVAAIWIGKLLIESQTNKPGRLRRAG